MQNHGMKQQDVDEGWELLKALGRRRLDVASLEPQAASLREQVDAWENYWYPVIDAVLQRHFPKVHERVFLNLHQADLDEVVFSVTTLLERLADLADPQGPAGADGPKALALLVERKVDDSVLAQARGLLEDLQRFTVDHTVAVAEQQKLELIEAEGQAWGWYLEWSRIARVAIKNRALLRKLGFLDSRGRSVPEAPPSEPSDTSSGESTGAGLAEVAERGASNALPAQARAAKVPVGHPGSSPFEE
jgi:hypothetical protein